MNKRIRYKKVEDTLVSVRDVSIDNGVKARVMLIPNDLTYFIHSVTNNEMLDSGSAISLQMLKIKVKQALVTMGAQFSEEKRNRTEDSVE